VFPTAITLCNGTSVGTLTAYTSRCAKHNFGNRLELPKTGLRFITQHFLFSYTIKKLHLKKPKRPPPLVRRYTH
jgi:hypothetical protein